MKYLIFIVFCFISCSAYARDLCFNSNVCFDVEMAKTPQELKKGLMFVKELPLRTGMLFDMRKYQKENIAMWMKNTYIPLDMVFMDCDFKVVDVYLNAKPLSLDKIRSKAPFCFVLEINGGEVSRFKIAVDDKAILK